MRLSTNTWMPFGAPHQSALHAPPGELAATAHPYLSRVDADRIYIALGIGETFDAIDALITAIARNHIPLSDDLVATTATWLDCYLGQTPNPGCVNSSPRS